MFKTLFGSDVAVFYAMRAQCRFCRQHSVVLLADVNHKRYECNNKENKTYGNDNCKPHNCPLVTDLVVEVP